MNDFFLKDRLENLVLEYCNSDELKNFPAELKKYAENLLIDFVIKACQNGNCAIEDITDKDAKNAMFDTVGKYNLKKESLMQLPELFASFLRWLQFTGRHGKGRQIAAFLLAIKIAYQNKVEGKIIPITNPGSKIKVNEPCPCGSNKKYKKCCGRKSN